MAADAERLSRLVRRLMELARAEVLMGEQDASVEAGPLLAAVADALGGREFTIALALPEQARLRIVVGEQLGLAAHLVLADALGEAHEAHAAGLERTAAAQRIRL
ncbi:hypothetical protein LTR94_036374, partial [Friedmanniomyces endolithicus]